MTEQQFFAHFNKLKRRLDARTDVFGGPDACWEWQGSTVLGFGNDAKSQRGYGQMGGSIGYARYNFLTHRLAMQISLKRLLSSEECVLHRCDNPACCNPNHLFLGDRADNCTDKVSKKRQRNGICPGESHGNSKVTEDDVRKMRELYASKKATQTGLAAQFGLSQASVWAILHRKTWNHI